MRVGDSRGFSFLEVLVAVAILGLAVSASMGAVAQGLRLLRLSAEHEQALQLAERVLRDTAIERDRVEGGTEGGFAWQRRVARMPLPDDRVITFSQTGATPPPEVALFSVVVEVRWGERRRLELATVRAAQLPDPTAPPPTSTTPGGTPAPGSPTIRPGAPGSTPGAGTG
jgi:prepilin-type N-terminal cleavage/methylation domain-containing protein